MLLPVHSIIPDPDQPRKLPRKGRSAYTSDDLRTLELRQPLIVRSNPACDSDPDAVPYVSVVGERLWRARRLYTSDAADDSSRLDLRGLRTHKKKKYIIYVQILLLLRLSHCYPSAYYPPSTLPPSSVIFFFFSPGKTNI